VPDFSIVRAYNAFFFIRCAAKAHPGITQNKQTKNKTKTKTKTKNENENENENKEKQKRKDTNLKIKHSSRITSRSLSHSAIYHK
jgi:hypothetical protein